MILDNNDKMARDKTQRIKNEPKRHKPASMSVKKKPAPVPKFLVTLVWDEAFAGNHIKVRLNPYYKA